MDNKQIAVVVTETKKFVEMLGNAVALAENVVDLEERAARAERTLANAEARHKAILAIVNVEEAAANAEARIADLKAAETKAISSKETAEKSLASMKSELETTSNDLSEKRTMLAELNARISKIRASVA